MPNTTVPPTQMPNTTVPTTQGTVVIDSVVFVVGRPLRRRNGRLHRARSKRGQSRLTDQQALCLAPAVREALAEHWRNQGELEHASVIAFEDLARRLAYVGAPEELILRSLLAARQETDHALRCFELASRYLGESLQPGRLRRPLRLPRSRETELVRLAVEALRDGVVNEGFAAWLAEQQLMHARDLRVQQTLARIACDEADHAALAVDVLAWCLAEGAPAVAAAVRAAAAELPTRMTTGVVPAGLDRRALADHGFHETDPGGEGYAMILNAALVLVPLDLHQQVA